MTTTNSRFIAKNGVDNNNNTVINVNTPTVNTEGANKAYVDSILAGLQNGSNGVSVNTNIVKIVRSKGSFFAQTADHRIISWGNNDWGQIGQGSPNAKELASEIMFPYTTAGQAITQFGAGGSTLYCLFANGEFYAWGANYAGQCNTGGVVEQWQPHLISINVTKFWIPPEGQDMMRQSVTTFGNATTWYQRSDYANTVFACGENGSGNIGINSTANVTTAIPVQWNVFPSGASTDTFINLYVSEQTGNSAWMIWRTSGGTYRLYCCGYNGQGQLGLGNTTTPQQSWVQNTYFTSAQISQIIDIQTGGYTYDGTTGTYRGWTIVTLYNSATRLLSVYTTGYNANSQLGRLSPTQQTTFGLAFSTTLAVGVTWVKTLKTVYNAWVLTSDGVYWHWGDNAYRQLVPANTVDLTTPTRVPTTGTPTYPITNIWAPCKLYNSNQLGVYFYSKTNPYVLTVRGWNTAGVFGIGNNSINASLTADAYPMINTLGYDINNILLTSPSSSNTATALVQFKNSGRLLFAGDSNDYESNTTLTTSKYAFCSLPLGNMLGK